MKIICKMPANTKSESSGKHFTEARRLLRRVYMLEVVLAMVILGSVVCIFYFHEHVANDRRLLIEPLIRSRLRVTEAHLLFDEIMHHGKPQHKIAIFRKLLDETERHLKIINEAQNDIDWFYVAFDEDKVRQDIDQLHEIVLMFRNTAQEEYIHAAASGIDPFEHKHHDETFDRFNKKMTEVEDYLAAGVNKETQFFNNSQKYLVVFVVVTAAVLGSFLARDIKSQRKTERNQENLVGSLQSTNKELAGIVDVSSHDLRSPLLNIQGFANELQTDCSELKGILESVEIPADKGSKILSIIDQDIPQALNYINLSADKMDSLIKGLLKLSRLGRASLEIENINMNILINDIIKTMQFKIKEYGIEVTVDRLPACLGDENQLTQVFSNLLDNAVKFLDKSGDGSIHVSGRIDEDRSIYCVEDNGIGIAPKHHEKIFQIFHRLESAESVSGEGLGLTIVQRIAERHGGDVWVESDTGKGSRFHVALPHPENVTAYSDRIKRKHQA